LGAAGERFFGSGNERTAVSFPSGYGYQVRWWDSWNLIVELMNHGTQSKSVYVDVTYTYRSASASVEPLKPVWLDIDNCGDSEYSIPAGTSHAYSNWKVNVEGKVVAIGGHLHEGGQYIEATNLRTTPKVTTDDEDICRSDAQYDEKGHLVSMGVCTGDPLAYVDLGDIVQLHSVYNSPEPRDDVMGIMLAYIDRMNVP
jgi:hypothetical protein